MSGRALLSEQYGALSSGSSSHLSVLQAAAWGLTLAAAAFLLWAISEQRAKLDMAWLSRACTCLAPAPAKPGKAAGHGSGAGGHRSSVSSTTAGGSGEKARRSEDQWPAELGQPPLPSTHEVELTIPSHPAEEEEALPELHGGPSALMSLADLRALMAGGAIPARYHGSSPWRLVYSTRRDGVSLATLFRKAAHLEPTLLLVKDTGGAVFGSFASEAWRLHPRFYGNGETCVFQLHPRKVLYHWKRPADNAPMSSNDYFQMGTQAGLGVGGSGNFAIWLDSELLEGSSASCATFASPCLSSAPDFRVHSVELWHL